MRTIQYKKRVSIDVTRTDMEVWIGVLEERTDLNKIELTDLIMEDVVIKTEIFYKLAHQFIHNGVVDFGENKTRKVSLSIGQALNSLDTFQEVMTNPDNDLQMAVANLMYAKIKKSIHSQKYF